METVSFTFAKDVRDSDREKLLHAVRHLPGVVSAAPLKADARDPFIRATFLAQARDGVGVRIRETVLGSGLVVAADIEAARHLV